MCNSLKQEVKLKILGKFKEELEIYIKQAHLQITKFKPKSYIRSYTKEKLPRMNAAAKPHLL